MLSCSIWFSAPSFWMGGGLESRSVGRVCGVFRTLPETCRAKNTLIRKIILLHQRGTSNYLA